MPIVNLPGGCYKRGMATKTKTAAPAKVNTIRVLVYRPGEPSKVEDLQNTLEAWQALVGGYVESVPLGDGICLLCNEEGKGQGLAPNFALPGDIIVGPAFFCRSKSSSMVSLTDTDITRIQKKVGR